MVHHRKVATVVALAGRIQEKTTGAMPIRIFKSGGRHVQAGTRITHAAPKADTRDSVPLNLPSTCSNLIVLRDGRG